MFPWLANNASTLLHVVRESSLGELAGDEMPSPILSRELSPGHAAEEPLARDRDAGLDAEHEQIVSAMADGDGHSCQALQQQQRGFARAPGRARTPATELMTETRR
jgi:hypothetical protein